MGIILKNRNLFLSDLSDLLIVKNPIECRCVCGFCAFKICIATGILFMMDVFKLEDMFIIQSSNVNEDNKVEVANCWLI